MDNESRKMSLIQKLFLGGFAIWVITEIISRVIRWTYGV